MMKLPRYQCIEGTVDCILGSHQTTDVSITERTTPMNQSFLPNDGYRAETHTFVNTSREFTMLLEVKGYTLKLVHNDYLTVALGDDVRAICEVVTNAPLLVCDWSNITRKIRFRAIPMPLAAAAMAIGLAAIFVLLSFVCLYASARYGVVNLQWWAIGAVALAAVLAINGLHTANRMTRVHAELDQLAAMRGSVHRTDPNIR